MLLTDRYAYRQDFLRCEPLHPAILQANHQVYQEAVRVLHGENIWIIAKVDVQHWSLILATMRNVSLKGAGDIKYPALQIKLITPLVAEKPQPRITLIMGEHSIEDFIWVLQRIGADTATMVKFRASSLVLTLCETGFHPMSKLQSKCLEPFGLVHGLRNLIIRGQAEPACMEKILHRAKSGVEDVLKPPLVSQSYLDKGNEALLAGEWLMARAQYTYGSVYLWHIVRIKEDEHAYLPPTAEDYVRLVQLVLVIDSYKLGAILKLGKYKSVKRRGTTLLSAPLLPDDAGMFARLCIACAHRALGEREDGSRLFEEALKANCNRLTLLEALTKLFSCDPGKPVNLLLGEYRKLDEGEAIDLDVLRKFWDTG